jgi:hypothetical protein
MTEALARHRDVAPAWDLANPTAAELRAWAIGVVGKDPPLPRTTSIVGARETRVRDRRAAVVQVAIEGEPVTYVVQFTPVVSPERSEKIDGELRAVAWRLGEFTCVAVGRAASATRWEPALVATK